MHQDDCIRQVYGPVNGRANAYCICHPSNFSLDGKEVSVLPIGTNKYKYFGGNSGRKLCMLLLLPNEGSWQYPTCRKMLIHYCHEHVLENALQHNEWAVMYGTTYCRVFLQLPAKLFMYVCLQPKGYHVLTFQLVLHYFQLATKQL